MLRFPNPGSDIDSLIRIYNEIYEALKQNSSFNLDDITHTLIQRNLATSSGFIGQEALARSTRADRSRDPLYNQSKSYTELFKILGWLHPSPESALNFHFTYLGAHIVEARRDPAALVKESLLGIVYPNPVLNVVGDYILRPFATILRTMEQLDGLIHRDEMILGPLSIANDRDNRMFATMISELKSIRGSPRALEKKLNAYSTTRQITTNTMGNYTRFPIAALKWAGWAVGKRISGIHPTQFLILTEEGKRTLEILKASRDIRQRDIENLDDETRAAISRIGFYEMLGRAGFDLEPVNKLITKDRHHAASFLTHEGSLLLFSPFQDLSPNYVTSLFPNAAPIQNVGQVSSGTTSETAAPIVLPKMTYKITLSTRNIREEPVRDMGIVDQFKGSYKKTGDITNAVNLVFDSLQGANKERFYPFIATLFRVLGYNCEHTRAGVNYQRWDAIIADAEESVPIEIKSPGEEEFISVKAVRQALENKIILLSRKPYPTKENTTSLVVGYRVPNDRAEVLALISDIRKAFNITIGVIDTRSLLRLAAAIILENKQHSTRELLHLQGIIDVFDT